MIKRIVLGLVLFALPAFGQAQLPIQSASNGNTACPIIGSGAFASKPASPTTCTRYFATDLGSGVEIVWNGSVWKPSTGTATIGQSAATGMSVTGTASETNVASTAIPGGLLSANGSLRITAAWTYTNSSNNKQMWIRFGASVGTAGTAYLNINTTTTASIRTQAQLYNQNSTSTQVASANGISAFGTASTTVTSSVTTASASAISFNGTLTNTGETITLQSYTVEWIEP